MKKTSKQQSIEYSSAQNKDQDKFDKVQASLSEAEMETQLDALIALFKKKQAQQK